MSTSPSQALKNYTLDLLTHLPLENVYFFAMVQSAGLFEMPGIGDTITAKPTRADKVSYFLSVIGPGADHHFPKLLKVMKSSGMTDVVQLADKITAATGIDGPKPDPAPSKLDVAPSKRDPVSSEPDSEQPSFSMVYLMETYKKGVAEPHRVKYDDLNSEQKKILDEVQAMIIVVNDSEFMATMCYLRPPNNQSSVLEVHGSTEVVRTNKPFKFYIGMFGKCPVAVTRVEPGHGRDAIDHIKYFQNILLIAAVGVAAGFPENNAHYGDVIISTMITDCSTYKIDDDGIYIPRGLDSPGCSYMISELRQHHRWEFMCSKNDRKSSVILGKVLSRPVLVNSKEEREQMLSSFGREAKGYEMEGYSITGFGIECIIIKGVCDYASGKTKEWQPTAALAANDYLHYHLLKSDISGMKPVKDDLHKGGST